MYLPFIFKSAFLDLLLQILCRSNSGHTVRFTLWNQDAHDFKKIEYEKAEQPVIIAVSSCFVKNYGGNMITLNL